MVMSKGASLMELGLEEQSNTARSMTHNKEEIKRHLNNLGNMDIPNQSNNVSNPSMSTGEVSRSRIALLYTPSIL